MRRWLTIGALLLVGLWAPFLYRELTSEPVETKGGAALADDADDALAEAQEPVGGGEAEPAAGGDGAEEAKPEAPTPPEAEEVPAQPEQPTVEAPATAEQARTAEAPVEPGGDSPEGPLGADGLPTAEVLEVPPAPSPMAVYVRVFESEPRDALWAREAEAKLLQVMAGAEVPSETIKSARCQKTVCRLELIWKPADSTAYQTAFTGVRNEFGTDMGVQNLGPGENEGEQRIDLYVPRQGYTLADLAK